MYCICPCLCICICIVFDDVKVLDKDPFGSKLLERYILSITSENNGGKEEQDNEDVKVIVLVVDVVDVVDVDDVLV